MARSLLGRLEAWWGHTAPATQDRLVGSVLVACTTPVLGLAMWLEPDPAGVGTHQQLGLGGCSVLSFTGWPCPMCGMTTTFTHMAHLEPIAAVITQPFGVLLFCATVVLFGVGVGSLIGRETWRSGLDLILAYELQIAVGTLVGMVAGWVYKCFAMGIVV